MIRFMEGVLISKCSVHLRPSGSQVHRKGSLLDQKGQGAAERIIIRM